MKDSEVLDRVVDFIHSGINCLDTEEMLDDFQQGESFVYHTLLGLIIELTKEG